MIWSDEVTQKLERLWKETDLPAWKIAKEFGCTRNTISGKAARLFGPGARALIAYRKPHALWSQDSMDILLGMIKTGHDYVDIGRAVGKSRNAVKHKVKQLGLNHYRQAVKKPARICLTKVQLSACWDPIPGTEPRHLSQLTSFQCHWPLWSDTPSFLYCGQAKDDVKDWYCSHHLAIGTKPRDPGIPIHTARSDPRMARCGLG